MNNIILSQNQTMSSKDIATASGKRHSDVIRDIRVMIDSIKDNAELRHDINQGLNEIKDERGYTKEFLLNNNKPHHGAFLLLTQLHPILNRL